MKALLLLCVICILHTLVISDDESLQKKGVIVKSYPKKVHKRNIIIKNSRKFNIQPKQEIRTKTPNDDNKYTVFPKVDNSRPGLVNVPESPYFENEQGIDAKPSVKKVLPEFFSLTRVRRAAPASAKQKTNEKKASIHSVTKTNKVDVKKDSKQSKVKKDIIKAPSKVNKPAKSIAVKGPKVVKSPTKPSVNNDKGVIKKTKNKKGTSRKSRQLRTGKRRSKHHKRSGSNSSKHPKSHKKSQRRRSVKHQLRNDAKVKASRRLIAAKEATIEDYPYVVSIQKAGEHWCAGALLNPRLVITTANCVWKSNRVSLLRVRAGSRDLNHGGQTAKIQEMIRHPHWSIRSYPDNDIALLLLNKNLRFSDSLHAVDLPNRVMLPPFDDAWVTSWGAERRDGVYDNKALTLQAYRTRLIERDKCNNLTGRFGVVVSSNFICLSQNGRRAPCTRDTGAPAVSDGVLWGLASWGIRKLCGTERFPSMFSYVASPTNMDFIINATHYLMSEDRYYPFLDKYPRAHARFTTPEGHVQVGE